MAITASMVKELREKTGAGMMDCKKALTETNGDTEKAVDWLRQKGIAKAAKKSGRATSEGLVGLAAAADGSAYALAAVRCETDFVARGDQFKNFAASVAQIVLDNDPADDAALTALLGDGLQEQIASVGENMTLGNFARMERKAPGALGVYVHANGKIGVLVNIEAGKDASSGSDVLAALAKNVAMQVAATNPMALDADSMDAAAVEREREVYRQKAVAEGKPAQIVERIAEGAVKKFQKEVCLLEQPYIRDDKKSVADIVREAARELGDTLKVTAYKRIQLTPEA